MKKPLKELFFNTSLYQKTMYSDLERGPSDHISIEKAINDYDVRELLYCKDCGRELTFVPDTKVDIPRNLMHNEIHILNLIENDIIIKKFRCSADINHVYCFIFLTNNDGLIKISEYPSILDKIDTNKFSEALDYVKQKELNQIAILESHGFFVAAFLYFRRIYEDLILKIFNEHEASKTMEISEFQFLRMSEKIDLIKDSLPDYMLENKIIYSVLSKGVHELTDEECSKYLPVIRTMLLYFLDEYCEKLRRTKEKAAFSIKLKSIHSKLSTPQ